MASAIAATVISGVVAAGYRVRKRIPIAGDTDWDYISADMDMTSNEPLDLTVATMNRVMDEIEQLLGAK